MYELTLAIAGIVVVYLGVRLIMKLREMARWKDADPIVDGRSRPILPSDLRELKIEEPAEDLLNLGDDDKEENRSNDVPPPEQTT